MSKKNCSIRSSVFKSLNIQCESLFSKSIPASEEKNHLKQLKFEIEIIAQSTSARNFSLKKKNQLPSLIAIKHRFSLYKNR